MTVDTETAAPAVVVTRGEPTAEELAALVIVLAAVSGGDGVPEPQQRSVWAHRGRGLGLRPLAHRNPNRAWAWRSGSR